MEVLGRIPGRPGLWRLVWSGGGIASLSCSDPAFRDTACDWITPGLYDLQINGIAGISFSNPLVSVEDLGKADARIRDKGVSRYLATIITCGREAAATVVQTFEEARRAGVLRAGAGIHLEGPWISPEEGFRGVHRLEHVRDPDPRELSALQARAGGWVRLVTVAPERPGAESLIRAAVSSGIAVSLGHTNAGAEDVQVAIRAGATLSTHLFNGCVRQIDRHRNVIFSQLAADELSACFIADSHHVPLSTLRIGLRAKGLDRSILVSDIAPLSGLADGEYEMEGNPVEIRDGGIFVKGSYLLSGAARTLDQDVEILGREAEPGIESALLMATRNPARAMGDADWTELHEGRGQAVAVFSWDGSRLRLKHRLGF